MARKATSDARRVRAAVRPYVDYLLRAWDTNGRTVRVNIVELVGVLQSVECLVDENQWLRNEAKRRRIGF